MKVTQDAKKAARMALEFNKKVPDSERVGLTKKEAGEKGINSGIARAQQLIRSDSIPGEDAKAVARFYQRFKGCQTKRCEMAINLWGGRDFGKKAVKFVENLS